MIEPGPPPPSDFEVRLTEEQVDGVPPRRLHPGRPHHDRRGARLARAALRPPLRRRSAARSGAATSTCARPYDSRRRGPRAPGAVARAPLPRAAARRTSSATPAHRRAAPRRRRSDVHTWGHMILKPPRVGGELPWHQDEAYWEHRLRIPRPRLLGAARPGDGRERVHALPARLAPRRGAAPPPPRRRPATCTASSPTASTTAAVAVPLAPGGATFHHCRTLHRTPPNASDRVAAGLGQRVPGRAGPVSGRDRRPAMGPRRAPGVGATDHPAMTDPGVRFRKAHGGVQDRIGPARPLNLSARSEGVEPPTF